MTESLVAFGRSVSRLIRECTSINRHNFLELLALHAGEKSVVRIVTNDREYNAISAFCAQHSLYELHSQVRQRTVVRTASGDIFTEDVDWNDPTGEFFSVIVSKTEENARRPIELENLGGTFRDFGRIYGYPSCCIDSYSSIGDRGDWIARYLANSEGGPFGHDGNRLAVLFDGSTLLPEFFPCGARCEESEKIGRRYAKLLAEAGLGPQLEKIRRSLRWPILIRRGKLFQLPGSVERDRRIWYDPQRAKTVHWREAPEVDDEFEGTDSVSFALDRMTLYSGNTPIAEDTVDVLDNRLLLFR